MKADAVECDRCRRREVCSSNGVLPDGWGMLRIQRRAPFLDTSIVELCPDCTTKIHNTLRTTP